MPVALSICIEAIDLQSGQSLYTRCVALPGRQPGLRLDRSGSILWQSDADVACELWVSLDDCLILYRPTGAAPVTVGRAGRSLEAPYDKPVVLIDQDQIDIGAQQLRVHIHGVATRIEAPVRLRTRIARALTTAAIVGAIATSTGGCRETAETPTNTPTRTPIEVRFNPPTATAAPITITPTDSATPTAPAADMPIEGSPTPPTAVPADHTPTK